MARRKRVTTALPDGWEILPEYRISERRNLTAGTRVTIKGEGGVVFRFMHATKTPDSEWLNFREEEKLKSNCDVGAKGQIVLGRFRQFYPQRVKRALRPIERHGEVVLG